MISKIVEKQLHSCSFAKIDLNNITLSTVIPKYTKPRYVVGKCYLIQVAGNIINNTNNILASNWNNGKAPQHQYYKAYVGKTIGTYIYCDCLVFDWDTKQDTNIMYSGWFELNDLTQIAEIQ